MKLRTHHHEVLITLSPAASEETGTSSEWVAVLNCGSKTLQNSEERREETEMGLLLRSLYQRCADQRKRSTNLGRAGGPLPLGWTGLIVSLIQRTHVGGQRLTGA